MAVFFPRGIEEVVNYARELASINSAFNKRLEAVEAFIKEHKFDGPQLLETDSEKLKALDKDLWKGVRHKTFLKSIIAASTEESTEGDEGKEAEKYGVNLIN